MVSRTKNSYLHIIGKNTKNLGKHQNYSATFVQSISDKPLVDAAQSPTRRTGNAIFMPHNKHFSVVLVKFSVILLHFFRNSWEELRKKWRGITEKNKKKYGKSEKKDDKKQVYQPARGGLLSIGGGIGYDKM
ncbi:MAG: hypothetical protein IJV38_08490 [Prevotella sp.]|nr:hypothetical protein [Prevotella sp.]